jgi:hypothetical protein
MCGLISYPPSRCPTRREIWSKHIHIKYSVQAKERRKTQFEIIFTHNICDVVRTISEWFELPMGAHEALFLQMQPPCHQPTTCVELDVGHVATCSWHWPFARYHEPIVGYARSIQKIWFLCLPQSKSGRNLLVKMEWEKIH